MKLISLVDNRCSVGNLKGEHGLCVYIETENHRILFDTGQSDLLLRNAVEMKVNLSEVDSVIISHAHYDHLGGLIPFLELNSYAKVYMNRLVFENQYYSIKNGDKRFIGYPEALPEYKDRFCLIGASCFKLDNMFLMTQINRKYPQPKGNKVLFRERDNVFTNDSFEHEMILVVLNQKGLCVFSGCAHHGILNIIDTVKGIFPKEIISLVYGGFHLPDTNVFFETESVLEVREIADKLMNMAPDAEFYTGHCTGDRALQELIKYAPKQFKPIEVGLTIDR